MSDQTPAAYTIVPWVRRGLASLVTDQPTKNFATLPVTLLVNTIPVSGPAVQLIGPGQITALDPRAVVRTDPRDGAGAFEPNYLPMVELALPDLPWMFTPSPPVSGRLQPWLCLVVVPDKAGISLTTASSGITVLRVDAPLDPKLELPDLSTIDAWAHAQVTGDSLSGNELNAALNGDPSATVSRLICPRKLAANENYIACVVPTFRAGVNAALGLPVDDSDLAPAWTADTSAPYVLPSYYTFRFSTGAEGDFASLAQKIHPPATELNAGTRPMDASEPGFGMAAVPGVTLGLEGALKALGSSSTPWPGATQATYVARLRAALSPPVAVNPLVAPPSYGSAHSGSTLPAAGAQPIWLGELNLDPRSRAAASAGAQIVQRDQEALAASAWDQLGEIRKANQLLRQAQLARQVSTSMSQRHLERVAGNGVWLQITSPVHARVRVTLAGATATVYGQVLASRVPSGSLSPAMRKVARPAGLIGRLLKPGIPQIVDRLNMPASSTATAMQVAGPLQPPRGMIALDDVSKDIQLKDMTAASVGKGLGWNLAPAVASAIDETTASPEAMIVHPIPDQPAHPLPLEPLKPPVSDDPNKPVAAPPPLVNWNADPNLPEILKGTKNLPPPIEFPSKADELNRFEANFRIAASAVNTTLNTAPAAPPDAPPLGGQADLSPVRAQLLAALNPANTLRARLGARIPLGTGGDPLQPIETGPKYPQAMYAPLAELSPEWMLPGISKIDSDCATLLATNPAFIESYMIGLNDEMGRELLWREFPADRTVTFFQSFWSKAKPDIGTIRTFDPAAHMGAHVNSAADGNQLVFLVRATLFQRYPNAIVYAAPAKWVNGLRQVTDSVQYPLFRGNFGQDVTFFGFDISDAKGVDNPASGDAGWYFVIAEHVTEPRVGLEPEKSTTPTGLWNNLSWPEVTLKGNYIDVSVAPPTPSGESIAWSQNSAALGYILVRRPVRVALHALALLGDA
jgi:hypothetical protein